MNEFPTGDHHGDTERVIAEYTRAARARWLRDPFKQTLRIAYRRTRELRGSRGAFVDAGKPQSAVWVPGFLRPPSLKYAGFSGPWFEEHYFDQHAADEFSGAVYLPVFWDNFFAHAQGHTYLPGEFARRFRAIWKLLADLSTKDRAYFTVQGIYEYPIWNWHRFPRNVLVLAAAGYGDMAIPLLMRDRPMKRVVKDIRTSFMGRIETHPVREQTHAAFKDVATFGFGPHWEDVMSRSHFSLCPRGNGPTSFRIFEALSVASIPVYIWDKWRWLPYEDELNWSEFSIVVEAARIAEAKEAILKMPPGRIQQMQDRIATLYTDYFSYAGVARWIGRKMGAITCRTDAEKLSAKRGEFKF